MTMFVNADFAATRSQGFIDVVTAADIKGNNLVLPLTPCLDVLAHTVKMWPMTFDVWSLSHNPMIAFAPVL